MRYDLVRKKYIIIILILIIIFSTYLFFSANNLKIKTENFTPNEITLNYQIKPENKSLLSSEADLSYLTVQTPPFDRKYPLILLKEKFDLLTRAHDHLFFAEKRLAELNKWGNDLDWGDNLGRYYQYMNQYIDTSADYSAIKQKLNAHQNTINKLIDHLEKNEKEKLALYQKAEKIFNQLNAKIPAYLQQFSQNEISYPFTEIVENKDYGVYNAVIEEDQPVFFKNLNLKLKLNKKQYPSSLEPETNICVFESIDIPITNEKSHPHLQLILPAISLTPYLNWDEKKIGNTYHYYTALPNLPKGEYIVKLTSKIVQPVELKLEHKYQKIKSDEGQWQRLDKIKTDTLLETTVYPSSSSQTSYHQFLIPEEKDMVSIEPILISKSRPLLITPNGDIWLDIYPYWTPEITLIKIDSNRDYYLAKAQDKADLQKKIALTLGIGSLAFLIYIVFKRIIIILLSLIGLTILQFINFLSRKIRQLWLITAIIGIIIDIFYFSQTSDLIIILLTLIWILAIVGYRLEARFSFLSAIIFLILCPILLILNKPLIAEKAAIWVYMMLLVGTFQSLIELKNKFTELITLEDLILKILKNQQVKKLKKILKNNLDNIKLRFFHLIDAIFVLKPKNKIDIILNVLKLAIIIVVLLLTSYLSYIVITKYRHYRMENEVKKARLAFNPVIAKIEPQIVYHGTKIIIFGRNFGWKENQKVRLLSTYGEVTTDLWTDGKIIFTIPLHWKMGEIGLWVEKQAEWERKRIIAKSAVVKLKLIPITDKFTPDDDSYFEQLKTLEKETLQLNGYKDVR